MVLVLNLGPRLALPAFEVRKLENWMQVWKSIKFENQRMRNWSISIGFCYWGEWDASSLGRKIVDRIAIRHWSVKVKLDLTTGKRQRKESGKYNLLSFNLCTLHSPKSIFSQVVLWIDYLFPFFQLPWSHWDTYQSRLPFQPTVMPIACRCCFPQQARRSAMCLVLFLVTESFGKGLSEVKKLTYSIWP